MKQLILIVGGSTLVYFCLAMLMGVLPGYELSKTPPGPGVKPLTELQSEGREVYVAEGCSYCHTQQVRPLNQDKIFGRPSAAGDFAYQTPELLGSERTGPDLTNVGVRQPSEVWQYIHLFNPRAVVPQSIMPSFSWMFDIVDELPKGETAVPLPSGYAPAHGKVVPSQQAKALVAYLMSLKQAPLPDSSDIAGTTAARVAASPAAATTSARAPSAPPAYTFDSVKGAALYTANCAACHQASGEGLPGAFPPLKGNAAVNNDDPTLHIQTVLHGAHDVVIGGVTYSSPMPPFESQLTDSDISNIINHERSSWGNHGKPVSAVQVAAERAKGK